MGLVSLVVMERGSQWPGHVGDFEHLVVVGSGEDMLVEGTRRRIDGLQRRGQRVRIAVLACGETPDPAWATTRAELARHLLAAVATHPFGRLVLTAPESASLPLRRELMVLVSVLTQTLAGTTGTVTLRFGNAESMLPLPPAPAARGGTANAPGRLPFGAAH